MRGAGRRSRRTLTRLRAQKRQYGEDAAVVVRRREQAEFQEDRVDVGLHGLRADDELLADPAIRETFGHQGEHLVRARRELAQRILLPPAPEELRDDLGIDRGASLADTAHALIEVVDREHAV